MWNAILLLAMTFPVFFAAEFSQHLKTRFSGHPTERQLILEMRKIISATLETRATKLSFSSYRDVPARRDVVIEGDQTSACTEGSVTHEVFTRMRPKAMSLRQTIGLPSISGEGALVCLMKNVHHPVSKVAHMQKRNSNNGDYDNLAIPLSVTIFIVAIPGISILLIFAMMLLSFYFSQTGKRMRQLVDLSQ